MKLLVFGLSVSSAWGNGHATPLRALFRALGRQGHEVVFFERNAPYYATHRDPEASWGCRVVFFTGFAEAAAEAARELESADAAMVTSYCPEGPLVEDAVFSSRVPRRIFYDLDLPVTLARAEAGEPIEHLGSRGLSAYDLVLSFTGGPALAADARRILGVERIVPLYGSVDPDVHHPAPPDPAYRATASYLGTYAADREATLDALFFAPARSLPADTFLLGGPLYPDGRRGGANVRHVPHVRPGEHAAFYASSAVTLSVTRGAMKRYGYCPSARLFEAAACGAPLVSDSFDGLGELFEPGREILIADDTETMMAVIKEARRGLSALGDRARQRVLASHRAEVRARELAEILGWSAGGGRSA